MEHPTPPVDIPFIPAEYQSLAIFLITGLVAGWIAGMVLGGGGLLRSLITGVIGAVVGGYVLKLAHVTLPLEGWVNDLATAVIGALVVIVVARVIAR